MSVIIDGHTLDPEQVVRVARKAASGEYEQVVLSDDARARIQATRAHIDAHFMRDDAPLMYSFNTGVGLFKEHRVLMAEMAEYQKKTVYAHATGLGEPIPEEVTRATMLLRANAFALNYSGPRVEVVERLLACLNRGLHPVMPMKGSVGASGDLAPLAHMSGAICGFEEASMIYRGQPMPARLALEKAGMTPDFELGAKDASALINGSTVSLAYGALALQDARALLKLADIAMALCLECLRGEIAAFDARLHKARPHLGQALVARNILRLVEGSKRCSEAARQVVFPDEGRALGMKAPPRVQDVYSLRCAPQVHGPVRDAVGYVGQIVGVEINSATDNPLIFDDGSGGYSCISGGHFHGAYVAQAMDVLAIAMADLGSISERRLFRLIDPTLSYGLPRNLLAGKKGLNTGYATVQCSMSALVMENRTLATPASVDSIPGKSNAEDHVSNSAWAARKARTLIENVEWILAGELLMAAQALSLVAEIGKDFPIGKGSQAALNAIRTTIEPALDGDRWYAQEMQQMLSLVKSGQIVAAVDSAIGALE